MDFEKLAAEAENGYELSQIHPSNEKDDMRFRLAGLAAIVAEMQQKVEKIAV